MKQLIKIIKAIKILLLAFLLHASGITNAQIGIGIANPAASAQLDVSSTKKGFLPPRMIQAERNAIANPVAGLMIWCKDCGIAGELQVYNGFSWTNMLGETASAIIPANITIGAQEWMTRNLDVVTYRNGDTIPQVTNSWDWNNLATGAWCYYNYDPANAVYGKLYNHYAITDTRGLAPVGWRIPTNDDWNLLSENLGSNADIKMRAATLWNTPVTAETNQSGFTGLPGGQNAGEFYEIGISAYWWSATTIYYDPHDYPPPGDPMNYFFKLRSGYTSLSYMWFGETTGMSVRCVRDTAVTIGTQDWMPKNLDVSMFNNGDIILELTDSAEWANATGPAWCYYNNDPATGAVYGKLYNWYAVNDPRGLAPAGWKVPSDADIITLSAFLGGMTAAGGKMKEAGTTHWTTPNTGATNESGFTALPGGFRWGGFGALGERGNWWTSSKHGEYGGSYGLLYEQGKLGTGANNFLSGFSVRCIRN